MKSEVKNRCLPRTFSLLLVFGGLATDASAVSYGCGLNEPGCRILLAQASPPPMQQMMPPTYTPPETYTPTATPKSENTSTRGIFLAMIAQQMLPTVLSGIGTWFNNKLNAPATSPTQVPPQMVQTTATNVAQMTPPPMPPADQMSNSNSMPQTLTVQMVPPPVGVSPPFSSQITALQTSPNVTSLQAGVAYQVSLVGRDGTRALVDPAQRRFNSGERVEVTYQTNLPGIVEIFNIDSTGRQELIDQKQVGAAQLTILGPYEFVNAKGDEVLRISLRPCVNDKAGTHTRGMMRAQINPELSGTLLSCEDPALKQNKVATRGIAKVSVEGGTNFALDPVSRAEIASGQLAPREVNIRFVHQ